MIPVPDELAAAEAASRLERVFGFVTGSVCLRCERDPERIAEVGMVAFARAQPRTFAVRVRRRDKSFPLTSQEIERQVGAAIQERTALPVDLSQPGPGAACRARRARRLRARARAAGRGRAAGRHQRPCGRAAVGRHRLSRRVAARDEAGPGGGVHPFQRGAVPRTDRDREGAGAGAGAERLPGCPPRRDVGGPVRAPAADALGGLAGVAPDRAVPPADGARSAARSRSVCERPRS